MPGPPLAIKAANLLLVEGEEETRFFDALLKERGRNDVQVHWIGKSDLPKNLAAYPKTPGFHEVRWLGLAQDADENPGAAFQRICTALQAVGLPVPPQSWEAAGSSPQIVAFVWPDGQTSGDLEALVYRTIEGEPVATCVEAYFECLPNAGTKRPRQIHKAKLHAYLASREPPDLRLAEAAEAGLLPLSSPIFDQFLHLLPRGVP